MTAATMARILSTIPIDGAAAIGRGTGAGRAAGATGAAGRAAAGAVDALAGAGAPAAVPALAATGAAGAGVAAATADGEGILMVGAAVGFGGKLIRTVSFFGCTLADSEGFGGTGTGTGLSAINSLLLFSQRKIRVVRCQMLIPERKSRSRPIEHVTPKPSWDHQ